MQDCLHPRFLYPPSCRPINIHKNNRIFWYWR